MITGAASGIGRHLAGLLRERGFRLALGDIRFDELSAAFGGGNDQLIVCPLDVTQPAAWQNFLQRSVESFGRIDYLFNIAGIITPGYVHQTGLDLIDRHFDINAKGVVYGTRLTSALMVEQGSGHIINVSSLAGVAPIPGLALYSASKFAVRAFSIAAAYELRPKGVFVSVVCPDLVDTPMLDLQLDYEEAAMTFSGSRRPFSVQDIGRIFLKTMKKKPIEVAVPSSRAWLAKLGNLFPNLSLILAESLRTKGLQRLKKLKASRNK